VLRNLINAQELARLLGVSPVFIYRRTAKNHPDPVPHLKVGRHLRFDPAAVEKWLEARRRACPAT
jgi:excisionase family DNA binding protein